MSETTETEFPAYAWPGSYPIRYYAGDGCLLCASCAREEEEALPVVGEVYWEGPTLHCEECNNEIESAYGNPGGEA